MAPNFEDSPEMALKMLKEELHRALASDARPAGGLVRAETHFPETDLIAWLQAQRADAKIFWSDREQGFAVAGVGVAAEEWSSAPQDLERIFEDLAAGLSPAFPNLRYYGGFRFDGAMARDPRWRSFGAYRFVIPQIEIGRKGNRFYVACNLDPSEDAEAFFRRLDELVFPEGPSEMCLPAVTSREDRPDEAGWHARVREALERIDSSSLEKVVLARESFFELDDAMEPAALLRQLVANTLYSYHFCIQIAPHQAFVGASPERLYRRANTYLQSEALAGTRARGETPEEDDALGRELLGCEKELEEHRFVADHVRVHFEKHCRAVHGGRHVELLKLRHVQHLLSRIEGMLKEPGHDAALLRRFHPTPAVGGVPTPQAMELIEILEPFDRGWWAGPVGWVGYDSTEFAVAIRSGLVVDDTLSLYSGAGIVPGSEPEEEWLEIENKMRNFLSILDQIPREVTPESRA